MSQTSKGLDELQDSINSLNEKNHSLKKELSLASVHYKNMREYYISELDTLTSTNQTEIIFFKKNQEALKVCNVNYRFTSFIFTYMNI